MRVVIDATPLIDTRTGIGIYVQGLIDALTEEPRKEKNIEVIEYTLSIRARAQSKLRGYWVPVPAGIAPSIWRTFNGPKIEKFVPSPDVVHGTNYLVPPSNVPRIVTVHDLSVLSRGTAPRRRVNGIDRHLKQIAESGATIHAISNYVADEIRERYPNADVQMVYPGVETSFEQRIPKVETPTKVVIGATQKRKAVPDAVRAFEILGHSFKTLELQIIGPPGDDEPQVGTLIEGLPEALRRRVTRLGFVARDEVARLVSSATLLVHPSHYEGFGFPLVEAMSMGTPVVTTTGGAIPEIVDTAAVTVEPGDVEALVAGISLLIENESLRDRIISSGLERSKQFSWATAGEQMLNMYRSVC